MANAEAIGLGILCKNLLRANPSLWTTDSTVRDAIRFGTTATLVQLARAAIAGLVESQPNLWDSLLPLILREFRPDGLLSLYHSFLESNETAWLIEPMLRVVAHPHVTNNRAFMNLAIQSDLFCVAHLGRELCREIPFLLSLVTANPMMLPYFPDQAFEEGPALLQQGLPLLFQECVFSDLDASFLLKKLIELIPLTDEFIHEVWIPSGGPLTSCALGILHPDELVPKQVWESFTLYCDRDDYLVASFLNAPMYLRADQRWMMERILERPVLYVAAAAEVRLTVRQHAMTYARFQVRYGCVVEDVNGAEDMGDYNRTIAMFLGSDRLRKALEYEQH